MKVLHLAAGNRWTGAAAPAFAEVAALRQAGVDAHYAFVGGYKLDAKIGRLDFTHAIIAKAQNPVAFAASSGAIARLLDHHGFDIVHAHLTYDHWLARFATRGWRTQIARTFHSGRVIRSDPFTKWLLARTDVVCVVNDTLRDAPAIRKRAPFFTPPPVNTDEFQPNGADVRSKYEIASDTLLITVIGKLSKDRGFELALETFAHIQKRMPNTRLMIIGHGEHRAALELIARDLDIAAKVVWAGYHEDDLADHYRASDFLLFTAKGSDEGHRAVIEAMACGTVPIVAPLLGMDAIVGELPLVARESSADALSDQLLSRVDDLDALRTRAVDRAAEFAFPRAAQRLLTAYSQVL